MRNPRLNNAVEIVAVLTRLSFSFVSGFSDMVFLACIVPVGIQILAVGWLFVLLPLLIAQMICNARPCPVNVIAHRKVGSGCISGGNGRHDGTVLFQYP